MGSQPRSRRITWLLLAVIVLAGLGLRVWYASWNLTDQRYWDEKYSLDNVRPIMLERTVTPVRGYYPSPVFTLPAALLFEGSAAVGRMTANPALKPMDGWHFTPIAILLSRLLMTFYGTVTLVLVFFVGHSMASARVGLLAAAALAFSPWMIHSSGYYKPDALLVMAVILAFYASLRAIESTGVRWYAVAGIAIAIAMSAKLTGGLAAMPLIAATLHLGLRDRRRIALLVLAGVTSAGVFILVNPYWRYYLHFLSGLKRDYAMRAGWVADTKLGMPGRVAGMLLDGYGHGPVFGSLALLGLALFGWSWLRRTGSRRQRMHRAMVLAFVLSYTAAYALQTPYFKGNNFLPLLPFTALAAAWVLDAGWRWVASRRPARVAGRALALSILVSLLAAAVVVPQGVSYVYQSLTPTTRDAALLFLGRKLSNGEGRLAYLEQWPATKTRWEGQRAFANGGVGLLATDNLASVPHERLRTSDGLVFRASGPAREPADRERWAAAVGPYKKRLFAPRLFHLRGPPAMAVFHRWTPSAPLLPLDVEPVFGPLRQFAGPLPAGLALGEIVSFTTWIPHTIRRQGAALPALSFGGQPVRLARRKRVGGGELFVSERLSVDDTHAILRFTVSVDSSVALPVSGAAFVARLGRALDDGEPSIAVHVHRWRSGT